MPTLSLSQTLCEGNLRGVISFCGRSAASVWQHRGLGSSLVDARQKRSVDSVMCLSRCIQAAVLCTACCLKWDGSKTWVELQMRAAELAGCMTGRMNSRRCWQWVADKTLPPVRRAIHANRVDLLRQQLVALPAPDKTKRATAVRHHAREI